MSMRRHSLKTLDDFAASFKRLGYSDAYGRRKAKKCVSDQELKQRRRHAEGDALWEAIKHGSEDHQQWLRDAIHAHIDGQPIPIDKGQNGGVVSFSQQSVG